MTRVTVGGESKVTVIAWCEPTRVGARRARRTRSSASAAGPVFVTVSFSFARASVFSRASLAVTSPPPPKRGHDLVRPDAKTRTDRHVFEAGRFYNVATMKRSAPTNVAAYIAGFPRPVQTVLRRVRSILRKAVPAADEGISYQIPAYKLNGKPVIYFAAFKEHYLLSVERAPRRGVQRQARGVRDVEGTIRSLYRGCPGQADRRHCEVPREGAPA